MPRKRKTAEIPNSQEQPYDSSFKALLDDQTTAMLSFLLREEVLSAYELKESLFKRETVKPAIRVDCVYIVQSRKYGQERIRTYIVHMDDFESIHDVNPFVQKRVAKGRAEGLAEGEAKGRAEGLAEGEAKGLQEAVVFAIELRFPTLLELAQQKAERVKEPEVLKFVLRGLKAAPNEETARLLLDTLAA